MSDSGEITDRSHRWHVQEGVIDRPLIGGGILYDETGGKVHHLNDTAACVWEACRQGATIQELVGCVCAAYEVTPEQADQDVAAIVQELSAAGALR